MTFQHGFKLLQILEKSLEISHTCVAVLIGVISHMLHAIEAVGVAKKIVGGLTWQGVRAGQFFTAIDIDFEIDTCRRFWL